MVAKLEKELEEERQPMASRTLTFSFPQIARSGREVIKLEKVSKRFEKLRIYESVSRTVQSGDRIAIIGVNGVGKTTLLKMIAEEIQPDSGTITFGANVEMGYYSQHHTEQLNRDATVLEEVWRVAPQHNETAVRSVCGAFLFSGDDVDKPIGVLSGGERARVLLARLLLKPGNLMLMDEPTNHLDLASAEALAQALEAYEGTLVFVSHNTSFVNRLATKVWDIVELKIVEHHGNLLDYAERLSKQQADKETQAPVPLQSAPKRESKRERKERKRREAQERNLASRETRDAKKTVSPARITDHTVGAGAEGA